MLQNSWGIEHIIARTDPDERTERPGAHRKCNQIFPKSFSRHCSALRSVTGKDCDKVPLLDDEYMRIKACVRRVAMLRGSCGGDAGAQVHLFLWFLGAPRHD